MPWPPPDDNRASLFKGVDEGMPAGVILLGVVGAAVILLAAVSAAFWGLLYLTI